MADYDSMCSNVPTVFSMDVLESNFKVIDNIIEYRVEAKISSKCRLCPPDFFGPCVQPARTRKPKKLARPARKVT